MEQQAEETKRPGELEVMTNVYFLYSEMMELLLHKIGRMMEARGMGLHREAKMNHTRLMEAYRAARRAAAMQGEFCDRLNPGQWDALHREANDLLRINLTIADRCGDDREKCLAIERAIRRLPSRGHISEGTIDMFTLK